MKCTVVKNDTGAIIVCGGRRAEARCRDHGNLSKYQCDFPIGVYKAGPKKGEKRTCDKHLCDKCVMHGKTKGVDFCREHYPIAKAAYEARKAREENLHAFKGPDGQWRAK